MVHLLDLRRSRPFHQELVSPRRQCGGGWGLAHFGTGAQYWSHSWPFERFFPKKRNVLCFFLKPVRWTKKDRAERLLALFACHVSAESDGARRSRGQSSLFTGGVPHFFPVFTLRDFPSSGKKSRMQISTTIHFHTF